MGYKATVDTLILKELSLRAARFADGYDPDRPSVVLVPGGMGARLLKTLDAYDPRMPFPAEPTYQKIWLSLGAILRGDHFGLKMTRVGRDQGNKPVIPFGEVDNYLLARPYDETREHFTRSNADIRANYVSFGYDWRKRPSLSAGYLRRFLLFLAAENAKRGHPDPRPTITLIGHSMGGLVVKSFLNLLSRKKEVADHWLERFVSVGTPFYGTQTHMSRYYDGQEGLNMFTRGGRLEVSKAIWTLPGLYVLLPAPKEILEPNFRSLGLNRYPVVDDEDKAKSVDPFDPEHRDRLPEFMRKPKQNLSFTSICMAYATHEMKEIDRVLPEFRDKIFHFGSTLRESNRPRSLRIYWQRKYSDPFLTNSGDSDGTVPLWSARLGWIPRDQVFLVRGVEHDSLAEDGTVLHGISALMQNQPVNTERVSPRLEVASVRDAVEILTAVRDGQLDEDSLVQQSPAIKRRFEIMFNLT